MIKRIVCWCKGFCILAVLYLAGELLSKGLGLFLPGSLLGMLLLALLLFSGKLSLASVEKTADDLVQHLILLFVPSSVGIMVYAKGISGIAGKIVLTVMLSTVIVLVVTGKTADWIIDWSKRSARSRRQLE